MLELRPPCPNPRLVPNLLISGAIASQHQQHRNCTLRILVSLQSWKSEQQDRTTVAVSAGNKAFIHWSSVGVEKKEGMTSKLYGLEMLVFNEQCKISEILVLRQPLESQKAELFGDSEE